MIFILITVFASATIVLLILNTQLRKELLVQRSIARLQRSQIQMHESEIENLKARRLELLDRICQYHNSAVRSKDERRNRTPRLP